MRRVFVKNILFILAVNLLIKPVWIFMIDRTVQNRVGHEAYGTYQALFNLSVIFQIILDFGLNSYNSRIISQEPQRLRRMFPVMLSARLILTVLYMLIVCATGWAIGFRGMELALLGGTILIQACNMLLLYIRSNVAALQHFRLDGILSVSDRFFMILVCGLLLWHPQTAKHFRIEWFVAAQVLCYGAALFTGFIVMRRIASFRLRLSFRHEDVLKIIKDSLPYASLIFMMGIYTRSDMLLLERLGGAAGKEEAGIYAAAFRLLDVGNIFGLMFAGMLLPMFGRMLAERQQVVSVIRIAVNIMLPLSMVIAIAAHLYGTEIMHVLYPAAGAYDGKVLAWLMSAFPAFCIMYVYSTLLTANGNLKLLNMIALAGVVINIGSNLYFIPREHALGAAIVAFITQSSLAVCYIFYSRQRLSLPYDRRWIAAHTFFPLVCLLAGKGISLLPVAWELQLSGFVFAGGILVFVFRFITVDSMRLLMKRT